MDALGRYILSVTCAAIIFGILQGILDKKSSCAVLLQFVGGLFLMFTAIAPITDFQFRALLEMPLGYIQEAESITAQAHEAALSEQRDIIKERCEAYILDKAISYRIYPEVEVTVSATEPFLPTHVQVNGNISPYIKKTLGVWIEEEIGISGENQIWIG